MRRDGRWTSARDQAESLAAGMPPLLVEAERIAATVAHGVHGRRRVGQGETFWQFRRYREEDPASAIDWRQSAKSQHLFVRETEWEAAESVYLWRDGSPSMGYRSHLSPVSKLERATVLTLAVCSLLIRGGERVGLLGRPEQPATGRATLRRLTHHLEESGDAAEDVPPVTVLPRFAQTVLIGDFLAPIDSVEGSIARLSAQGVRGHMLQVLDAAEEDWPFEGRTRFEGMDDPLAFTIGRAESLRDAYRAKLAAHRAALAAAAARLGWTFATHRTDRPAQGALLALYAALAGARSRRART